MGASVWLVIVLVTMIATSAWARLPCTLAATTTVTGAAARVAWACTAAAVAWAAWVAWAAAVWVAGAAVAEVAAVLHAVSRNASASTQSTPPPEQRDGKAVLHTRVCLV